MSWKVLAADEQESTSSTRKSPCCWFCGYLVPIQSHRQWGSSSLYHCVPWFSDTDRADAGFGDVGSMVRGGGVLNETYSFDLLTVAL
jgi:hypothetical protein